MTNAEEMRGHVIDIARFGNDGVTVLPSYTSSLVDNQIILVQRHSEATKTKRYLCNIF